MKYFLQGKFTVWKVLLWGIVSFALFMTACPLTCHEEEIQNGNEPETWEWPESPLFLPGVNVVDADGFRGRRWLVVSEGKINAVFDLDPGEPPPDAKILDVEGSWISPGLVDPHVHLFLSGATIEVGSTFADNIISTLRAGITSVVDAGGPDSVAGLMESFSHPMWIGPSIRFLGPFITAEKGHPCEIWNQPDRCAYVNDTESAKSQARRIISLGFSGLKISMTDAGHSPWPSPGISSEEAAMALSAPSSFDLSGSSDFLLYAHIDTVQDAFNALDAGAGHLAHTPFGDLLDTENAAEISGRARAIHTTMGAFSGVLRLLDGTLERGDTPCEVLHNWDLIAENPDFLLEGWIEESARWTENAKRNLRKLREAGANILPASDAGYMFVPHGAGFHHELQVMLEAGYSPIEVLSAATREAALAAGFKDRGLIMEGMRADILVLEGNPLEDLKILGSPDYVIAGGHALSREELGSVYYPRLPGPSREIGKTCISGDDCESGACDAWTHICRQACPQPWAIDNPCGASAACLPGAGGSGVCQPLRTCDLYRQDCMPKIYGEACVPIDRDTAVCRPSGPRNEGESCGTADPFTFCKASLTCSPIDGLCYRLCDPSGEDTCTGGRRCIMQYAAGEPWYGLCL